MYSVVTGFYGCSHGNLFVWMYPCELVCVDDVSMGTGLCEWYPWELVCVDGVSMGTGLCGWCMGGSCCDYLVLLWLCLCNILYQILFDVNNVFNDPDSMFYQNLVNKLSLCLICFVYFSVASDDLMYS